MSLRYFVRSSVRVRRERFGVLFYDTHSARLTYVASGEGLIPLAVDPDGSRELAIAGLDAPRRQAFARLLEELRAKGLIVAVDDAEL